MRTVLLVLLMAVAPTGQTADIEYGALYLQALSRVTDTNGVVFGSFGTVHKLTATNWTSVTSGTNELGYVVTNHIARIMHERQTNEFFLKCEPSGIAVWRPITFRADQFFRWQTNIVLTNNFILVPGK